jgi:hypothetical protein
MWIRDEIPRRNLLYLKQAAFAGSPDDTITADRFDDLRQQRNDANLKHFQSFTG